MCSSKIYIYKGYKTDNFNTEPFNFFFFENRINSCQSTNLYINRLVASFEQKFNKKHKLSLITHRSCINCGILVELPVIFSAFDHPLLLLFISLCLNSLALIRSLTHIDLRVRMFFLLYYVPCHLRFLTSIRS